MNLFNFDEEKALVARIVQDLCTALPPTLMQDRRHVLSVNKITRALERGIQAAKDYQAERRPGFVRRSVFANQFKWALKDQGYPPDFINMATEGLVIELARARSKRPKA